MRILFINQYYLPDFAATAQILGDLAEALARDGHDVHVLSGSAIYDGRDMELPAEETINGVRVHRVRQRFRGRARLHERALGYLFFHVSAHLRALALPKPDVVVTLTTPPLICLAGVWMAMLRGSRHVSWVMDIYPEIAVRSGVLPEAGLVAGLWGRLSALTLRRAHRVVTLSKGMKEVIEGKGAAPERISIIPPWADAGALTPPDGPNPFRQTHADGAETVVMYSGNMGTCHPWREIAEAVIRLQRNSGILFLFVGGGKSMPLLRDAVKDCPNVRFLPYQEREDLAQSLSAADIHLTCLDDRMDGLLLPSKLFGIMSVARPVLHIGTPSSDVGDLLRENGCGLVIPPGGGERLAETIEALSHDKDRARALGEAGRKASLEKFDRTILVARLAALLEHEARGGGEARRPLWAGPIPRLAFAALILAWGLTSLSRDREHSEWAGRLDSAARAGALVGEAQSAPQRSGAMRRLARAATERVFPRRWDAGGQIAAQWMTLRPFSPEPWVLLARSRAMTGRPEEAAAALGRAAGLAPSFPAGLLEALPVWMLLGEREHAAEVAREIAALDPDAPLDVAPALQAAGFSPGETAAITFREDLDPTRALRLLGLLARPSVNAQEAVHQHIPHSLLADPAFRIEAARVFSRPFAPAALEDLWRRHDGDEVKALTLPGGARFLMGMPSLPQRPAGGFPFGWHNPPDRLARSLAEGTATADSPRWRIEFRSREPGRAWLIHRALLTAPAEEFPIELHLDTAPANQSFRIIVEGPGGRSTGPWHSASRGGRIAPGAVSLKGTGAGPLEILLERRGGDGGRENGAIRVIGLSIPPSIGEGGGIAAH